MDNTDERRGFNGRSYSNYTNRDQTSGTSSQENINYNESEKTTEVWSERKPEYPFLTPRQYSINDITQADYKLLFDKLSLLIKMRAFGWLFIHRIIQPLLISALIYSR